MRISQYLFHTMREEPAAADSSSHRLMLRAGMVRPLAAGIYSWLPLGLRVLHKITEIVREEMNRSGALELLMPMVQPGELWRESGRWQEYGSELLRLRDRNEREFCLGPTHEEVITELIRNTVGSYRALPVNLYQIQNKFRDEVRPRFGVMRSREFLMKDAYSFHTDAQCLAQTYEQMRTSYKRIFERIGLRVLMVDADSGSIGGNLSHEFHALADCGEDQIAFSDAGDYAANLEQVASAPPPGERPAARQQLRKVDTGAAHSMQELAQILGLPLQQMVKTLLVEGAQDRPVALVLRGDHSLNEIKAQRVPEVRKPLRLLDAAAMHKRGLQPGNIGPAGLENVSIVVDHAAAQLADFACGANVAEQHYTGANWGRDCEALRVVDLRNAVAGDRSPDGRGQLQICRGIEVGHIFQLGCKYSEAMNAAVDGADGRRCTLHMGCYGIGIGRAVAAMIEQNHDSAGMIFPAAIAPFQLALVALNPGAVPEVSKCCEDLYHRLTELGVEVLFDDRDERPGVKLADMELIGIPHRLTVGKRGLQQTEKTVEYRARTAQTDTLIPVHRAVEHVMEILRLDNIRSAPR